MYAMKAGRFVTYLVTAIAATALCAPAWGQGRGREGGKGKEGSKQGGETRSRSGEGRSRQDSGREVKGGEKEVKKAEKAESRTASPSASDSVRSQVKEGKESRRGSDARQEITVDDNWRHRRGRHHDHDRDFSFGVGLGIGPFYGFYGRPWYSYYGPWHGFYGPAYGYYGPWSGSYAYGWPYYYGDTMYSSSYFDPEAALPEAAPAEEPDRREPATTPDGLDFQRRADAAFRQGRYDEAVRMANHAAVEMPDNGKLFLFMSQALFAVGDFGAAAGAAHQGMAMSDSKSWGTVVENFRQYYGNANDYTEQLRRLEKFAKEHPDAPYARFLLGYHYGFLGHEKEARAELAEAVKLEERDELAGRLLAHFGGEASRPKSGGGSDRERTAPRDERGSVPPPE